MNSQRKQSGVVRVIVVSGNHLVRVGLRRVLEANVGILLVGESCGGAHACSMLKLERPDLVVMDLESEVNVAELVAGYKQAAPQSKIVLLSGWSDVERARQGLTSGAEAMVLKCQSTAVLLATVESAMESQTAPASKATSPSVLIEQVAKPAPSRPVSREASWAGSLTDRERSVVGLIGQGLSNRDIADRLCISETTVRHHLTSIFDKLGVSNRQKLLIRAHQAGLVELTASA